MRKKLSIPGMQAGFTLIELVVVVSILGFLVAIVAPSLSNSTDGAKAQSLLRVSQKLADNWMLISSSCGTTGDVANSPVTGSSAANTLLLLLGGNGVGTGQYSVPAAYTACYTSASILALADSAQYDTGTSAWQVTGYVPTLSWTSGVFKTAYASVPDSLALAVVKKYNPGLAALAASDATHPVAQYSVAASGTRTLTILRPIS